MSTHDNEKNIALTPELLAEVEKLASSEHRTTDEIVNEAARKYLDIKHTIADMDSFVARNRKDALAKGIKESDVVRLVKESRKENRNR